MEHYQGLRRLIQRHEVHRVLLLHNIRLAHLSCFFLLTSEKLLLFSLSFFWAVASVELGLMMTMAQKTTRPALREALQTSH